MNDPRHPLTDGLAALVARAQAVGVTLWTDAGALRFRAPKGAFSAELRAELSANQAALIDWLERHPAGPSVQQANGDDLPEGEVELSAGQKRWWMLGRMAAGEAGLEQGAHIACVVELVGALDVPRLRQALGEIVQRHEPLRTVIHTDANGDPVGQLLTPVPDPRWPLPVDAVSAEEAPSRAQEEAALPFDLNTGPLIRTRLLRIGQSSQAEPVHQLVVTLHHMAADGWSLGVLVEELARLYAGRELAPLPARYSQIARAQELAQQSGQLQQELNWWRERLRDVPALQLPAPDTPVTSETSAHTTTGCINTARILPENIGAALLSHARAGLTPFMLIQSALWVLLSRLSGQSDFALGTPVANRPHRDSEALVGFFVNTLVLRSPLGEAGSSVQALWQTVREHTLAALAHQSLPFDRLVEELQPERQGRRNPFFNVLFAVQNAPIGELKLPGLQARALPSPLNATRLDVEIHALPSADGSWSLAACAREEVLSDAAAQRLLAQLEHVLERMLEQPQAAWAELDVLDTEQARQIAQWQAVQPHACDSWLERVQAIAQAQPHALAYRSDEGELSYLQLAQQASRWAKLLRQAGVEAEVPVAVLLDRGVDHAVLALAVWWAGGVYLPLDVRAPAARLGELIRQGKPALIVASGEASVQLAREALQEIAAHDASQPLLIWDLQTQRAHLPEHGLEAASRHGEQAMYLLYTSGSTGVPKGVLVRDAVLNNLSAWQARRSAPCNTLQFAALSFDVSIQELVCTWVQGATLVGVAESQRGDARALVEAIVRHEVGRLYLPVVMLHELAEAALLRPEATPVREIITAGEALRVTPAVRRWAQRERFALDNQYGPTETHVVSAFRLEGDAGRWPERPPIGQALPNAGLRVLDARGRSVPIGVAGQLWIDGAVLARGYHAQGGASAQRFVAADGGARAYRTGDRARWDAQGQLHYLGRDDHQVKVRGHRVELGEVEAQLRRLDGVAQALVLLQGGTLGAWVQPTQGATDTTLWRRQLRQRLPEYMVPTRWHTLEQLPRNANGKLDRRAIAQLAQGDDETDSAQTLAHEPVRTQAEHTLAALWSQVLQLPVDRIGRADDFFALGGHSLKATQLATRIERELGVVLPLARIFEQPVLADQAAQLHAVLGAAQTSLPELEITDRSQPLALSFAQERLWFLNQFTAGEVAYNMPASLRLRGRLDVDALARTFAEIVRRHEALRTGFETRDGQAVQRIEPAPQHWHLPLQDLSALDAGEREVRAKALALEEAQRPFDLARAPMLRTTLLRLQEDDHVLLATLHHIAADGWSLGLLVNEISTLYAAFAQGQASPLAELERQYVDFALWQRGWLRGERLERELDYWRGQLKDLAALQLPTDRPRPAVQSSRGAVRTRSLNAQLAKQVRELAQAQHATPFMVLLAALQALLARLAGQRDVVVGTALANRTHVHTEPMIGFFVNSLVMRTRLHDAMSFAQLLEQVRSTALAAYEHQALPFEKLVEALAPERDASRHPLFQVAFAVQNAPIGALQLPGLSLGPFDNEVTASRFDLEWHVWPQEDSMTMVVCYATDLFDAATIDRWVTQFETLLGAALADVSAPLASLPMDTPKQQAAQRASSQGPLPAVSTQDCVHRRFEAIASHQPDATALVCAGQRMTYGELDRRANRIAHALRARGIAPEQRVAIHLERSCDLVAAILGVWKASAAYVPMDPVHPPKRLAHLLRDSGAMLRITSADLSAQLLDHHDAHVPSMCLDDTELQGQPDTAPVNVATPAHLAYLLYTSGSTGEPKGVLVAHGGVDNLQRAQIGALGIRPDDRALLFASIGFDASVSEMCLGLLSGATLVIADGAAARSPERLEQLMRFERVTVATLTPSLLAVMSGDYPDLRVLLTAGEACPASLARQWASRCELVNAYGPTEITVAATMSAPVDPNDDRVPAIGLPIAGTCAYVVDPQGRIAPTGVAGELWVGGMGVTRGYHRRAALTAERFLPDPWSGVAGARLYRTGDQVRRRDDGSLEYLGRIDQQIKLRGQRIEPGEIEAVLRRHPAVRDAVVDVVDMAAPAGGEAMRVRAAGGPLELWPSIAEHFVYDETMYHAMTHDEVRNAHYRVAFQSSVPGKVVVDVGTGADAILARMCVDAGARHVYAIERLQASWESAHATVQRLGLADRITVIHGDATTVTLPESVDLCVSEIVGPIGGAEGSAVILNEAWRFIRPGGHMIPSRTRSLIAAVELPEAFLQEPAFTPLTAGYTRRIFEDLGGPFDLRLCLKGASSSHLISDAAPFEDLDHHGPVALESGHDIELTVHRDGLCAGFLVWLQLMATPQQCLDTLDVTCCWLPVYLPAFNDGLHLRAGTVIRATVTRRLAPNGLNPDFFVSGLIQPPQGPAQPFAIDSPHGRETAAGAAPWRATPFYRRLFGADDAPAMTQRLVAWAATRFDETQAASTEESLQRARVTEWRELYESTIDSAETDADLALAGWNSSYTGEAIPTTEMRTWRDATAHRIRALRPRRLWEIGCGNGLLLWPLAPACEHYRGTDFSAPAVAALAERLARESWPQVEVDCAEAAEQLEAATLEVPYDTVVMNSVVQYFPGIGYLERVLRGVARVLAGGGRAFIGDVRGRQWLGALHASVTRHRHPGENAAESARRARAALAAEEELTVDPAWFTSLQLGGLRHVDIWLKDEDTANELSWFRYDVTLHFGESPAFASIHDRRDWRSLGKLDALEQWLSTSAGQAMAVSNLPNARVSAAVEQSAELGLQSHGASAPGVALDAVRDAAARHGWRVRFAPAQAGEAALCDALFERADLPPRSWKRDALQPCGAIANNPLRQRQEDQFRVELPAYLRDWLPEAMVPAAYVIVDQLPRTASGKIDRLALPPPQAPRASTASRPAADAIERALVALWEEVLGTQPVGVDDNFFSLGGHSLLAVQLMSRIRARFGVALPLALLLEQGTVSALAKQLRESAQPAPYRALVPLRPEGLREAVYFLHPGGGGPMCYLGLARQLPIQWPVHGFQPQGLNVGETALESVEAIAASYVEALRRHQPNGPYHLVGWSFGGHLAYEMACQIREAGHEVGLLAVLDAMPPEHVPRVDDRYREQHAYLAYLAQLVGLAVTEEELEPLDEGTQIELVAQRAVMQGVLPEGATSDVIRRVLKLTTVSGRLAREYRPRPYAGRLHFLRALEPLTPELGEFARRRPDCGWSDYTQVTVHEVPGSHQSMIMEPHTASLARLLAGLLPQ